MHRFWVNMNFRETVQPRIHANIRTVVFSYILDFFYTEYDFFPETG